jgi:E3 ubiquitin-protein ligase TRIP12
VASPPVMSTSTFIMVLRMMSTLCTNCPELSQTLLKNNIAETLGYLLTGSPSPELTQVCWNYSVLYYSIFKFF